MASAIGSFEFRTLSKPGMPVERSLSLVARAGVDGHEIWDDGQRGMPFTIRSEVFVGTIEIGYNLIDQFKKLKGLPPVPVIWGNLFPEAALFKVLDVTVPDDGLRAVLGCVGPGGPYFARLICDWTLLPIYVEPEED